MNNFAFLGSVPVTQLLLQLKKAPQLWDQDTARTAPEDSPHHGASDIWLRYHDPKQFMGDSHAFVHQPHDCVWYPASDHLPAVKDIAFELMHWVRGERLGGVLITRVPPGGQIKPHVDDGYNALTYDKFAVLIESAPGQGMYFEEGCMEGPPGSVFWFRNDVSHWVINDSPEDRITLIVCIQPERRATCLTP